MQEKRNRSVGAGLIVWSGVVLLCGILLGASALGGFRGSHGARAGDSNGVAGDPSSSPFVSVAEAVLPGVVSVEAKRFFQHPPIPEDSTGAPSPFGMDGEITIPSTGSGFVFDDDGHILTNNHVINGATSIWVHFVDGTQLQATLVGTDPPTDVAVLRVESDQKLPTVPLGDSDALRIGEWVAAVGNPMGVLEGSLTVGVVSAKARTEIEISGSSPAYQDFIQTDAAINFGNSGGPLVNTRGEAVGINTAFGGPGRGIGFAVSINLAKEVARHLIETGRVTRGYLGVVLQRLDGPLAAGLDVPGGHGVLIRQVQSGTPADDAGFESGDVVLSFDGVEVKDLASFRLLVARTPVGRGIPVRLFRHGTTENVRVELTERPDFEAAMEQTPVKPPPSAIGLTLSALPGDADLDGGTPIRAVMITDVAAESLAGDAGLQAGDAILEVDGQTTANADSCLAFLRKAESSGHPAVIRVQRGGEQWYIGMPFPKKPRP